MRRVLLRSNAFVRAARRYLKRHPQAADDLRATLSLLAEDAFDTRLKTHKLTGELAGSWACSAGYDLRIVFSFVQHENAEAICWRLWERTTKSIEWKPPGHSLVIRRSA